MVPTALSKATHRKNTRLIAAVKESGMSDAEIAYRADVSVATLWRLQAGVSVPQLTTAVELAEVLGKDVADLFPDLAPLIERIRETTR